MERKYTRDMMLSTLYKEYKKSPLYKEAVLVFNAAGVDGEQAIEEMFQAQVNFKPQPGIYSTNLYEYFQTFESKYKIEDLDFLAILTDAHLSIVRDINIIEYLQELIEECDCYVEREGEKQKVCERAKNTIVEYVEQAWILMSTLPGLMENVEFHANTVNKKKLLQDGLVIEGMVSKATKLVEAIKNDAK